MKVKVTVAQTAPVFFNKEETLLKLEKIARTHSNSSDLLLFPESFVPGYPRGFSFGTKVGSRSEEGRQLYRSYFENSIDLSGNDRTRLEKLAKETSTYLIIGATEKVEKSGSLYCSMIYVSPHHGLLGVHRKIKPTGLERVIWAEADGSSLVTYDTSIGKLGGLICWENYMPLARQAMYNQGIEIYLAPTADSRESWTPSLQHIAMEGRCFVLGCNQYVNKSMYPETFQSYLGDMPEEICSGGSMIVDPYGKIIAGPIHGKEEFLKATLDLEHIIESKLDFDINGHYSRPDIFELDVRNQPEIRKENRLKA